MNEEDSQKYLVLDNKLLSLLNQPKYIRKLNNLESPQNYVLYMCDSNSIETEIFNGMINLDSI